MKKLENLKKDSERLRLILDCVEDVSRNGSCITVGRV